MNIIPIRQAPTFAASQRHLYNLSRFINKYPNELLKHAAKYCAVYRHFSSSSYIERGKLRSRSSSSSKNRKDELTKQWDDFFSKDKLSYSETKKSVRTLLKNRTKPSIINASSKMWNSINPRQFSEVLLQESLAELLDSSEGEQANELKEYFMTLSKALEELVSDVNDNGFSRHRNQALMLLKDKLVPQLKQVVTDYDTIADTQTPLTLEDFINPKVTDIPRIALEVYRGNDEGKWPQNILAKYNIQEVDVDSKFQYLLTKAHDYCLRTTEIVFTPLGDYKINLSNPARWFPLARQLKRKIIMHVGPTNSGKTYNALKKLENSKTGFFAGPLRLLAREVYERFKAKNIPANLITGEEIIEEVDENGKAAGLTCGTTEMLSITQEYDIVVLDEIQMMADRHRGSAWTQALLAARAKEIHLCGEESAVPLVRKICDLTGDTLEVNTYKRLGKLEVENRQLGKRWWENLKKGDCVVAFSKYRILEYRALIEQNTKFTVSVIYGALPAETRITQAFNFNSGKTDILVASDAVGMGLNLSIRRIIFSKVMKFDGENDRQLTVSEIKQIAGRAGRYKPAPLNAKEIPAFEVLEEEDEIDQQKKSQDQLAKEAQASKDDSTVGYVTSFARAQSAVIKSALTSQVVPLSKACLWAPEHVWSEYIAEFPSGTSMSDILRVYNDEVHNSELFFTRSVDTRINNAHLFEHLEGLVMADKLSLMSSPFVDSRLNNDTAVKVFTQFCETIAESKTRNIFGFDLPLEALRDEDFEDSLSQREVVKLLGTQDPEGSKNLKRLETLEMLHRLVMTFCWLTYRYPYYFVDRQSAFEVKNLCEFKISQQLAQLKESEKLERLTGRTRQSQKMSFKERAPSRRTYREKLEF